MKDEEGSVLKDIAMLQQYTDLDLVSVGSRNFSARYVQAAMARLAESDVVHLAQLDKRQPASSEGTTLALLKWLAHAGLHV